LKSDDKKTEKEISKQVTDNGVEKIDRRHLITLSVAALGVVFGDIGTSPLYAIRECFYGEYNGESDFVNGVFNFLLNCCLGL